LDWSIDVASVEKVVEEGILLCNDCKTWYPIINYVPVLLSFLTQQQKVFYKRNKKTIDALGSFNLPNGIPLPGEKFVQKSFTKEWGDFGASELKFSFNKQQILDYNSIELDWPDWVLNTPGKKLLEVGIGFGQSCVILEELTNNEIFGIDLNLSVIENGEAISKMPFVNVVIASLFKIPFPKDFFDIVYSNGVLHHTFSTRSAFHSILRYMNKQGMIYIWLYILEGRFYNLKRIPRDFLERYARPIIARLPLLLQNMIIYPAAIVHYFSERKALPTFSFKNALHGQRDEWTPLYAHHLSIISVIEWFQEAGLTYKLMDTVKIKQIVGRGNRVLGIRGIKNNSENYSIDNSPCKYIDCSDENFLNKIAELIERFGKIKLSLLCLKIFKINPFFEYRTVKSVNRKILEIIHGRFLLKYDDKWAYYRLIELLLIRNNIELLIKKIETLK
jgi:SAM-dependent methyltransferase